MQVIATEDYEKMSKIAAKVVAGQIYSNLNSVLGLATGSTIIGLYKELIRMHHEEGLDFSKVTTFNLDEYIGLNKDNPNSYYQFMMNNFFKYINIKRENINIPNGVAEDIEKECLKYEEKINKKSGIDLQILGIGRNGHIGFNEPDVNCKAITHKVKLDDETIEANSRFFSSKKEVPQYAISMGIKSIMFAKKIILLANGRQKAEAIYKAVKEPITSDVPASILQLHRDITIIIDKEAGYYLK